MGDIDIFKNDDTTQKLLQIIVMSSFYNFQGILDTLTDILNERCKDDPKSFIDKTSQKYQEFRKELFVHTIKNTLNYEKEHKASETYMNDLDSETRLESEKYEETLYTMEVTKEEKEPIEPIEEKREPSIYDDFERTPEPKETIIENADTLPVFTEILGESESASFAKIMQMIVEFYAVSGINIAIKFAELNEIQKGYALLLGVLAKAGYSSYRMGKAIKTGVVRWGHVGKLLNIGTTYNIIKFYWSESSKYKELRKKIEEIKGELTQEIMMEKQEIFT